MSDRNLYTVSNQWAWRPDDQRFLTIDELYAKVAQRKAESTVSDVSLDKMKVLPTKDGHGLLLTDGKELGGLLTHWSFGQLCSRVGAAAPYLRSLPAGIASGPLQYSLENRPIPVDADDEYGNNAKVVVRRNGSVQVSCITSPTYGRIWDEEVVRAVRNNLDQTKWKVPSASYQAADPRRATTLYASDRDVFIFLVSENVIEADGECVNRGIIVSNSEVGKAKFRIMTMTYDYVCDNRIIWGVDDLQEISIRHTSGAPERFLRDAVPQITAYANSSTVKQANAIRAAKAMIVGNNKEEVLSWVRTKGFTVPVARRAFEAAEHDPRGINPRSLWGVVQGLTDAAHEMTYTDERADIERKAGKLLEGIA